MVVKYIETGSQFETIRLFQVEFPNSRVRVRHTVDYNYNKYLTYGTSENRNKGNSGRPRTVRTEANIELIREALQENPCISASASGI